jgi:hypothetical protein
MSFKLTAFYTLAGCSALVEADRNMNGALIGKPAFAANAKGSGITGALRVQ